MFENKKNILILLTIFIIALGLFLKFKPSPKPKPAEPQKTTPTTSPFPTWEPKKGLRKPTITYERIPFKKTDKTRKVEIFGCIIDDSVWGMSYPKKVVEVPNVSAIATETMKSFLKESAETGWGGFPTKDEVERFLGKPGETSLKKLTVDRFGTARVYFSNEVMAYGGGSGRVACMHDSVELTLKQFSPIKSIVMCIENVCADQKGAEIFQP